MDGDLSTDSLRSLAPHWSLAGDDKLLEILQNTHKKIISKCQEVNAKLDIMTSALDDASISLQNANNRFMALSNSQFIESRVYDDDHDHIAEEAPPAKEKDPKSEVSQVEILKKSLAILESMHEAVTILRDSDTESDSDDGDYVRIVLKPKDLYKERPLPHIIGSEAWKSKWHAGLLVEDSDSDSVTSKPEGHTPEYSESDDEETVSSHQPEAPAYDKGVVLPRDAPVKVQEQTPSDIAAELARRLTAQAPQVPEYEEEYSPPRPAVKAVYKPQQPPTGVIFSDEPPPLERYDSESSEEDIFAELHKSQPYAKNEAVRGAFADELFGGNNGEDMFADTDIKVSQTKVLPKPSSNLREDIPEVANLQGSPKRQEIPEEKSRKPTGGISLFGSSKGADSIGAAILKRNMKRQSISDDESDRNDVAPIVVKNVVQIDSVKKEKDILSDLFAKSKTDSKKGKNIVRSNTEKPKEDLQKDAGKVDLFSDNIFDDIDDIFSSNIVKVPKTDAKSNKESIFDDDVDLFADIPSVAPAKVETKVINQEKKALFDSDDDLFADKSPKSKNTSSKIDSQNNTKMVADNVVVAKKPESINDNINVLDSSEEFVKPTTAISGIKAIDTIRKTAAIKSIFDSDSDSDIFSSIPITKPKVNDSQNIKTSQKENRTTTIETHSKQNVEINTPTSKDNLKTHPTESEDVPKIDSGIKSFASPSLFDDDDGDDNLFATGNISIAHNNKVKVNIESLEINKNNETLHQERTIQGKITTHAPTSIVHEIKNSNSENRSENLSREFKEEPMLNASQAATPVSVNTTIDKPVEDEDIVIETTNDNVPEKEALYAEEYNPVPNKVIFGEILSEPPAFEKATESKKSKNVNALFDDDSDDEALFFRKSDVIDEVQEDFLSKANQDAVFGLFHDEPPAIDVDFGPNNIADETKPISSANIFSTSPDMHNIFEKPNAVVKIIPETPIYTPQLPSDDFTKDNDLFSSIDSQNIFTPTKEAEVIDETDVAAENDFEDFFKSTNNKAIRSEQTSNIRGEGVISKPRDEDLFGQTTDKLKEISHVSASESTKNAENFEDPDSLFSSLKIPPKASPKPPPLDSDFDNSEEELFKPRTNVKNHDPVSLTDSKVDLFNVFTDSSSKVNETVAKRKLEGSNDHIDNIDKKIETVSDASTNDRKTDAILSDKNATTLDTSAAKSNANVERKIETEDIVDRGLNRDSDVKKIGKLKSNLNINVATLLPGASPKNQNKLQTFAKQISKEDENFEKEEKIPKITDPTVVKSISFEGEPNSDVLDNKLSKERAKIQVKRRPSTRRARREAVRKSVIDLEDSTDNSSSIDEPPKSKSNLERRPDRAEVSKKVDANKSVIEEKATKSTDLVKKTEQTVTKVVYVLNDDDIFNTKPKSTNLDTNNQFKNDDVLVENQNTTTVFKDGIKTIGKVYEDVTLNKAESTIAKPEKNVIKTKSSLFGDQSEDDDELFNKNRKPISKTSIFDSGSEEDLFTGKKKEKEKKIVVKSSLFSDDDDGGDDLFAVKTNKVTDSKTTTSKPQVSRELTKTTEPVFDDPLSMLGDD